MNLAEAARAGIEPVCPEIDFAVDEVPDFHERMARLRDAGHRVVPVRYLGELAWALLRYEDVAAAYADDERLPAAPAYRRHSEPVQGCTLLAMEGNEHRVNRLLVSKSFHPGAIRLLQAVRIHTGPCQPRDLPQNSALDLQCPAPTKERPVTPTRGVAPPPAGRRAPHARGSGRGTECCDRPGAQCDQCGYAGIGVG